MIVEGLVRALLWRFALIAATAFTIGVIIGRSI